MEAEEEGMVNFIVTSSQNVLCSISISIMNKDR